MTDDRGPVRARLAVVILAVEDVARSWRSHRDAFGWPMEVDEPVYVELPLPDGACLGVYDRNGFGRNTSRVPTPVPPGELSPAEVCLRVDDLDGHVLVVATPLLNTVPGSVFRFYPKE